MTTQETFQVIATRTVWRLGGWWPVTRVHVLCEAVTVEEALWGAEVLTESRPDLYPAAKQALASLGEGIPYTYHRPARDRKAKLRRVAYDIRTIQNDAEETAE